MANSFLRSLLFLLLASVFFVPDAHAESVFVFHFDKVEGKLQFDTQSTQVTTEDDPNFSIVTFSRTPVSEGEYHLTLFDVSGARAFEGNFSGKDGKFTYEVPYFDIVNKYEISLSKTQEVILSGSLDQYVRCNNNGVCEIEKGENLNTCVSDCASGHVKYSDQTLQQLDANKGEIFDPKTGEVILRDLRSVQTESNVDNAGVQQDQPGTQQEQSAATKQWVAIGFVVLLAIGIIAGIVYLIVRNRSRKFGI